MTRFVTNKTIMNSIRTFSSVFVFIMVNEGNSTAVKWLDKPTVCL